MHFFGFVDHAPSGKSLPITDSQNSEQVNNNNKTFNAQQGLSLQLFQRPTESKPTYS